MTKTNNQTLEQATVYDHIRELRMRLFASVIVLVLSSIGVYFFYEQILKLLTSPLGAPLYYDTPAGSFSFIIKICLMGALVITIPVIVYNLIMFVQPAFNNMLSKKCVYFTTFLSTILAISGAVFAYSIILPGSLHFFAGFQINGLKAIISADNYLNFVTNIIITFIIVFQLPLVVTFIDTIKPLTPKKLLKSEKWVILGSLIVALVVPFTYDLVTSLLIALPIVVLYNLSIVIILVRHYQAKRKSSRNTQVVTEILPIQPIVQPVLATSSSLLSEFPEEIDDFIEIDSGITANLPVSATVDIEPVQPVSPVQTTQATKAVQAPQPIQIEKIEETAEPAAPVIMPIVPQPSSTINSATITTSQPAKTAPIVEPAKQKIINKPICTITPARPITATKVQIKTIAKPIPTKPISPIKPSTYKPATAKPISYARQKQMQKFALMNNQVRTFSNISRG